MEYDKKKVLIMAAVEAEQNALVQGLKNNPRFDVCLAGVGPVAAAVNTMKALTASASASDSDYGLVVSAGIGGGFPEKALIETLVVANEIVAADLGAETPGGFRSMEALGFGSVKVPVDAALAVRVAAALREAELSVVLGPVLTVSTVTGSDASMIEMAARVPGAAAEAMEGYGVALAARELGLPVLELRAISNLVGPREREAWKVREALARLEAAASVLLEVL